MEEMDDYDFNDDGLVQAVSNRSNNGSNVDYYEYDYDISESLESFDWKELGPSLFIYSVTFLAGFLGNVLILVAVSRQTHVKSSTVNVFLASLASADLLLISICLPLKVAKLFSYTWTLGSFTCKLLSYLQTVSGICSGLNLTALSFERFYAIVHPLKAQYLCTISKAQKTVLAAWILAFLLGTPTIFAQIHLEVGTRRKGYWCIRCIDDPMLWRSVEVYLLLVILVVPSIIMGFSYGRVIHEVSQVVRKRSRLTQNYGRQLSSRSNETKEVHKQCTVQNSQVTMTCIETQPPPVDTDPLTSEDHIATTSKDNSKHDDETKQVIRMLISIVVVYVLCWGPLLIFNVIQSLGYIHPFLLGTPKYLKTTFSLMAYLNSCLNPIIYGFMSKNFRQSFSSQLHCLCSLPCFRGAENEANPSQQQDWRTQSRYMSVATTRV